MFYLYKFDKTLNVLFSAISICQRTFLRQSLYLLYMLLSEKITDSLMKDDRCHKNCWKIKQYIKHRFQWSLKTE